MISLISQIATSKKNSKGNHMEIVSNKNHLQQNNLLSEVCNIIDATKQQVAVSVNSAMTMMYWHIGDRINREVLGGERAAYGKQIVARLAEELSQRYNNRQYSKRNLHRMMQFAEIFPDYQIVTSLMAQLSWTHILQVIPLKDKLQREFYLTMAADQKWSVRTLKAKIDGMLFERTAISRRPELTIQNDLEELRNERKLSADLVFQDPYFLDFLGLSDKFTEKDLESAILANLQQFLIEFGNDFAFMARQKRITIDNEDYYIDLLFFHRRLRCMVVIECKLGAFKAAYKGQVELYLRWLEKHEMVEGENKPIGLILCAGKNEEHVELMHLEESNIRVAEYLTKLPSKHLLEEKLKLSIKRAEQQLLENENNNHDKSR